MKKISIITLGCKVNQVESEKLAEKLEQIGYEVSMGLNASDIYVINTCAVTNEAERKSRNYISKILRINPNARIYVCGCSSENNPEPFKKGDFVKKVIGTSGKMSLADCILSDDTGATKKLQKDNNSTAISEIPPCKVSTRTRVDLFVQNGCNNFCTYCLIPYLRGRETSFPLSEIAEELEILEHQANEIVVTGINLSSYGKDIEGSEGLIEIARLFRGKQARFRFSSLEVNVITKKFLRELATFPNFCEHFHLSLQSGSNATLKAMNRHYTAKRYLEKVNLIREIFPNAGITTDIIVGFPTETDEDFAESLEFCKKVRFSSMHIFPYSRRQGTPAEKFKNVTKNVTGRVKQMTELARTMQTEFIEKNLGLTHEVIIESVKDGYHLAHTKNYILCYIDKSKKLKSNEVVKVKLVALHEGGALAELL